MQSTGSRQCKLPLAEERLRKRLLQTELENFLALPSADQKMLLTLKFQRNEIWALINMGVIQVKDESEIAGGGKWAGDRGFADLLSNDLKYLKLSSFIVESGEVYSGKPLVISKTKLSTMRRFYIRLSVPAAQNLLSQLKSQK
jgi:hypothetical protein